MGLTLTTAPAVEPVTTAEVKEYLRVDTGDTSQDSILTYLIKGTREALESYLRRSLIAQTWTWELDSDDARSAIWLPRPTATAITSMTVYANDASGTASVVDAANYELVEGLKVVSRNDGWQVSRREKAMTIVYTAGPYANAAAVPARFKLAILGHISEEYELRGGLLSGTIGYKFSDKTEKLVEGDRYYGP